MKLKWIVVMLLLLISTACTPQPSSIYDNDTPYYVAEMDIVPDNMILVESYSDEMDQGKHHYSSKEWGTFIVDPKDRKFARGDVVYIRTPEYESKVNPNLDLPEYKILRIVGLPGEKLKINKGKIYINNRLLDTFYGSVRKSGLNWEEYQKVVEERNLNPSLSKDSFEIDFPETKISNHSYFLKGDNWWRSVDSIQFGEVSEDNIIGKIIGYKKDELNRNP
ncbi:signal peptidase I [Paenibacillus sp. J2TS4]|uniref:signal peptidase I n=1 Tax=Paenibacillus sp. J2TS4 TaxID=2807194 RepID=UPI001B02B054|nr:signal peptidase I [Paenibacillus sp. J2TS4]GIP36656.1 signal peptidase I [Paenibacillus sp. J2TS4]